jgi:hypothetical protein
MKLEDIIAIANKAYPDDMIQGYFKKPRANLGDTLAKFVASELDSTYGEDVPDAEQLCTAARVVEKAASELTKVANAFRAKLYEPLKKLEEQRHAAAEKAWDAASLPGVEAVEGWDIDGRFWSRKVFWSNGWKPSVVGSFGVSFEEGSAKILDQWNQ